MSTGSLSAFIRRLRGELAAAQPGGLSDGQLLDRWLARHDQAAFEVLVWRHGPMVLGVCRRVLHHDADVEDAFQAAFLLLVRKADAIRRRGSLAAWLYRTATRVALQARTRSGRLRARESNGVDRLGADDSDGVLWRDVRPLLDDEIARLPEKYRVPFIRCYLEGCTNEEAAAEMGCPVGTIYSRLAWARERLRARLTRRGLTVAGAGLAALLANGAATAALPAALVETTLQAAFAYAVHSTAAVGISAGAVALTKGVLRTMLIANLKLGVAAVLALTLCGGTGGLVCYRMVEAAACPPRGAAPAPAPLPGAEPALAEAAPRPLQVPSDNEGKIVGVATEVKPGEVVPEKKLLVAKCWLLGIAASDKDVPPNERLTVPLAAKGIVYRQWRPKDGLPANDLAVGYLTKTYRKLSEGDPIKEGQLLALVDPIPKSDELRNRLAKLAVAESDWETAIATKAEAKSRYDRIVRANLTHPGAYSPDEEAGALLTWKRYVAEELAKKAAVVVAQREVLQAQTDLENCAIRSPTDGVLKTILVRKGEAVKRLGAVVEVQPSDDK